MKSRFRSWVTGFVTDGTPSFDRVLESGAQLTTRDVMRDVANGGLRVMPEPTESRNSAVDAVKDALRYLGEASYAVLPEDMAHRLAEFEKSFWGGVRCLVDKELDWIDARLAGGDRLREEWKSRRTQEGTKRTAEEGV